MVISWTCKYGWFSTNFLLKILTRISLSRSRICRWSRQKDTIRYAVIQKLEANSWICQELTPNSRKSIREMYQIPLKYGRIWWGVQRLFAFNGINFSNRLPLGRTYANNSPYSELILRKVQSAPKFNATEEVLIASKYPSSSIPEKASYKCWMVWVPTRHCSPVCWIGSCRNKFWKRLIDLKFDCSLRAGVQSVDIAHAQTGPCLANTLLGQSIYLPTRPIRTHSSFLNYMEGI